MIMIFKMGKTHDSMHSNILTQALYAHPLELDQALGYARASLISIHALEVDHSSWVFSEDTVRPLYLRDQDPLIHLSTVGKY